jgi:hypothetical protein
MEFKGTKVFDVEYHTTMYLPYKYTVSNVQETDEEAKANALLISKAPEMLEMLQNISINEMITPNVRRKADKLIKEATII